MVVSFRSDQDLRITEDDKKMLAHARSMPIIYDEDSPELTEDMVEAFKEARRKKPFRGDCKSEIILS